MKVESILTTFIRNYPRPEPPIAGHEYLTGVRGLVVIQTFLWFFLITFLPAAVKDAANTEGPLYRQVLRKTLSVLFWNESLLYSTAILLSARTICIPFLTKPSTTALASAVFRRSLGLLLPLVVTLAITTAIFHQTGVAYIERFKAATGNTSIESPSVIDNGLVFFNACFNLFWTTRDFSSQAGNRAFPSQTLWLINVLYIQSYSVYMTLPIIPHTRARWRLQASLLFILSAWWVQSWAWFSITGLLVADATANMDLRARSQHGIKLYRALRLPAWLPYSAVALAGLVMQYVYVAWRPQDADLELRGHAGLYYTGGLNTRFDLRQPQARADNYLVLLGALLLLETSPRLRALFSSRLLVALGRRSYAHFLAGAVVVFTVGIKLFLHLTAAVSDGGPGWTAPQATGAALVVCMAATLVFAEMLYWLVEVPARRAAGWLFEWITR